MAFGSKRFEVKSNPWSNLSQPGLSNLSDFFPEDDERLKWQYTQYGGQNAAYFDPINKKFYPNYGQHELSRAGGDAYGNFHVPIPRISPIDEGMFQTGGSSNAGCPSGFYQFGKVCVPDVAINPNSPGNSLHGGPGGQGSFGQYFGKGDAKGLINAVVPPQMTAKNQEFIVLTDMQNVGGQPAKFYTRITIPELNIVQDVSNSTLVMPLAKMKIGHRVIMPSTVASNNLLQAKVDLCRLPLNNTGDTTAIAPLVDDQANVSIPSPGYRGAMPPPGGGLAGTIPSGVGFPLNGPGGVLPAQGFPGGFAPPPYPPPPQPWPIGPLAAAIPVGVTQIIVNPIRDVYPDGENITVVGSGFVPAERVVVQIYNVDLNAGIPVFQNMRKERRTVALPDGTFVSRIEVPENRSGKRYQKLAVVAIGDVSQVKATQIITAIDK